MLFLFLPRKFFSGCVGHSCRILCFHFAKTNFDQFCVRPAARAFKNNQTRKPHHSVNLTSRSAVSFNFNNNFILNFDSQYENNIYFKVSFCVKEKLFVGLNYLIVPKAGNHLLTFGLPQSPTQFNFFHLRLKPIL